MRKPPKPFIMSAVIILLADERSKHMASKNTVSGTLVDDKGTWTVRGRVTNPITGKVRNKSKSTGYKVKDNTKRKALQVMLKFSLSGRRKQTRLFPTMI